MERTFLAVMCMTICALIKLYAVVIIYHGLYLFSDCFVRVCQKWKRLVSDKQLWKHIDLSPYDMDILSLKKFASKHFTDALQFVCLKGSVISGIF